MFARAERQALEDHGLAQARAPAFRTKPPDAPGARPDQPMAKPQDQALAGAVGSEDHRARAGGDLDGDRLDQRLASGRIGDTLQAQREDAAGFDGGVVGQESGAECHARRILAGRRPRRQAARRSLALRVFGAALIFQA